MFVDVFSSLLTVLIKLTSIVISKWRIATESVVSSLKRKSSNSLRYCSRVWAKRQGPRDILVDAIANSKLSILVSPTRKHLPVYEQGSKHEYVCPHCIHAT